VAGLVPAIHVLIDARKKDVDARDKRGHDESEIAAVGMMHSCPFAPLNRPREFLRSSARRVVTRNWDVLLIGGSRDSDGMARVSDVNSGDRRRAQSWLIFFERMAEPEGFEPSIGLYNPITV
jgi:hypothetical protein